MLLTAPSITRSAVCAARLRLIPKIRKSSKPFGAAAMFLPVTLKHYEAFFPEKSGRTAFDACLDHAAHCSGDQHRAAISRCAEPEIGGSFRFGGFPAGR